MGLLRRAGIGLVVLATGAAAYYWLHNRGAAQVVDISAAAPHGNPGPGGAATGSGPPSGGAKSPGAPGGVARGPLAAGELPLRQGEVLEFSADVAKLTRVATLRLIVNARRSFGGRSAWHLQAFAHTQNPLRMVFLLDDQFDSYSDAFNMNSLQYEMHLNERGQKVDSVQRMTTTGHEPAPPDATATKVLPGTRDPLGLMQFLRNTDWSEAPELRSPVYDGHKIYEVRAKAVGEAAVTVPAGRFLTTKIRIRVFENGAESKDASFTLYLAKNEARLPVLLEAVLPVATARVALEKFSAP